MEERWLNQIENVLKVTRSIGRYKFKMEEKGIQNNFIKDNQSLTFNNYL